MKTKVCGHCRRHKELSEFYAENKSRDRLRGECKTCVRVKASKVYAAQKAMRLENKEKPYYGDE